MGLDAILIRQKEMLLEELEHRVVNSLQIIASIIMLKARAVESEETRRHLEDAHKRVISVATVQKHLRGSATNSIIEMGPYLATLCSALAQSMIGDNRSISIKFNGKGGSCKRRDAEGIGLIVTELVINSLKHAFDETTKDGEIKVSYDVSGTDWQLPVSDNGFGKPDGVFAQPKTGLGCSSDDHERSFGNESFGYARHVCGYVIYAGTPHPKRAEVVASHTPGFSSERQPQWLPPDDRRSVPH
jgi:chemotaxis protein methyltransferase CheR